MKSLIGVALSLLINNNIITVIGRYKDSMHVVTIFNTRSN